MKNQLDPSQLTAISWVVILDVALALLITALFAATQSPWAFLLLALGIWPRLRKKEEVVS